MLNKLQRQKKKLRKLLCAILHKESIRNYKLTFSPRYKAFICCSNCVFYSSLVGIGGAGKCNKHSKGTSNYSSCDDFYCPSEEITINL